MNQALLLVLHVLATVVWVGGMFFAHQILRPVTAAQLEPPTRLTLWNGIFSRFFVWVWSAVIALPATGYALLISAFGGMKDAPVYVHIMNGSGLAMIVLFLFVYFLPYPRLRSAVAASDWQAAAGQLTVIRRVITINMTLGLVTIAVATGGSYF